MKVAGALPTPDLPSERRFAVLWVVVLAGASVYALSQRAMPWAGAFLLATLCLGLVAIFRQRWLRPLNLAWFQLGLLLGRVVNPLVLAILFFGLITPFGVLGRLAGRDPLRLRRSPQTTSWWRPRDPPGPDAPSFRQPF